jgi:hypothetical protein
MRNPTSIAWLLRINFNNPEIVHDWERDSLAAASWTGQIMVNNPPDMTHPHQRRWCPFLPILDVLTPAYSHAT